VKKLIKLAEMCECEVVAGHNQHKNYYETAEHYLNDPMNLNRKEDCVDYDKMIETDSIWWVQAYPSTPIGFYMVYASNLDDACQALIDTLNSKES